MTYNADSIQKLSFREGCRKRVGIYLGSADMEGVVNGLLELVNNSTDEALVFPSANEIEIVISDKWASCRDRGRGLPRGANKFTEEVMIDLLTLNHSGAKFDDSAYGGKSRGLNGSGGSATCCSAEWFHVESKRDGFVWTLQFNDGVPATPTAVKGAATKETGTYIKYQPSQEVFRAEEIHFDYEKICGIIEEYSYFNKGLRFRVISDDTKEVREYYSENGLLDFAKTKIKNPIHETPLYHHLTEGDTDIEIICQWTAGSEKFFLFSNGGENPEGGTPITGARTSITRNLKKIGGLTSEGELIRTGLVYIISIKLKNPIYNGQIKSKISNPELRSLTDKAFSSALEEFSRNYPKELEQIIAFLTKEQRAESAADRARQAVLTTERNLAISKTKKVLLASKLKDCISHGPGSYLCITEGDSALGALIGGRDVQHAALLPIRGKLISALKNPLEDVLANKEISDILICLGVKIQGGYNAKDLRYEKVCAVVDADNDGLSICALIITAFWVLLPDFVREGRLCWLRAPLFRLRCGTEEHYAYSEEEKDQILANGKKYEVTRYKGVGEASASDIEKTMFGENRRLEVFEVRDEESFVEKLNLLMGPDVPARREYIMEKVDFSRVEE